MASPSTNEVLFVVIIVIIFFILLGVCLYCVYRATTPTKRQRQLEEQRYQQQQYITASQLETLRPPELARQLNDAKRTSLLNRLFSNNSSSLHTTRPSAVRPPSFLPMQQPPAILVHDNAMAARDAQVAAAASNIAPPAYGDHRTSVAVPFPQMPPNSEKN